jgi:integrase
MCAATSTSVRYHSSRVETAKLCRLCGVPHNRHSYASAALASASGWHDVKIISQRLGHSSVAITLDTYSHVLPAADEQVAHTLASVILGGE